MREQTTKERVIEAAIMLFYQKGFHATTTRDITNKVGVNGSLISYHFHGKQGLLEEVVISYYEQLIACVEEAIDMNKDASGSLLLKRVVEQVLQFKQERFHQSVVVHRELSLDSTFVREVLVTYITKENYHIHQLLSNCYADEPQRKSHIELMAMQLKGMLIAPFTLHHEWKRDVFSPKMDIRAFINYTSLIHTWIDEVLESKERVPYSM